MKTAGSAALSQSVAVSVTDQVDNLASSPTFPIVQDTMAPTFPDPGHRPLRVSNTGAWVQAGPVMVSPVTKYYTHGGSRVAMRQGDEVYYLHGDHLGSTSLTTDSSGAPVSEVRYLPYGEERWTNEVASPTDFGFTSQRADGYMELIDYGARWYDPQIGRFISPDTIIPDPANPQSWNRYAYVTNNPKI